MCKRGRGNTRGHLVKGFDERMASLIDLSREHVCANRCVGSSFENSVAHCKSHVLPLCAFG